MAKTSSVRKTLGRVLVSTAIVSALSATASAQNADAANEAQYAALLQQIADLKLTIAHKNTYVAHQEAEIALLQKQINGAEALNEKIDPMLAAMAKEAETAITSDIPFKPAERFARLDAFKESLASEAVSPGEKMRKGLGVFSAEVGYGSSLEAYNGDNPVNNPGSRLAACRENTESAACGVDWDSDAGKALKAGATPDDLASEFMDGTYLRYGRLALSYMQHDGSEGFRYDKETKAWVPVAGGKMVELRRGIRIARGEAAPGVVTAPIVVAGN